MVARRGRPRIPGTHGERRPPWYSRAAVAAGQPIEPDRAPEETETVRRSRWWRRAWERRKERVFPPGAVTFHLEAWGRRRMSPEIAAEARRVAGDFGLEPIWIVHGCAFLRGGEAAVLAGPPGMGKSRLLFALERAGSGRCLEDGLALVGLAGGRLQVLETGTLAFARREFRINLLLRRLLLVDRSVFSTPTPLRTRGARIAFRLLLRLPDLAFKLNVVLPRVRAAAHTPRLYPVGRVVAAPHPGDPYPSFRLDGGRRLETVRDLGGELAPHARVVRVSPLGTRSDVARRVRDALLASTSP